MKSATKSDWKTEAFPDSFSVVAFERVYTHDEYEKLKMGLLPHMMEDKWFIYYEGNILHFHRSWTGFRIYQLSLEKADKKFTTQVFKVNRDKEQYHSVDDEYDKEMLEFLINRLLLRRQVDFPSE